MSLIGDLAVAALRPSPRGVRLLAAFTSCLPCLALAAPPPAAAAARPAAPSRVAAPPPADPCAEALPITDDIEEQLAPARESVARWTEYANRCSIAGAWFRAAASHALVAQAERAVVQLSLAVDDYRRCLEAGPSAGERPLVEERLRRTEGALAAWRARPLLGEARDAAARDDGERALASYDAYLKAAENDPERGAVVGERARFLDLYRDEWRRDARKRRAVGGLSVGLGLLAAGGGAWLIRDGLALGDRAETAPNVAAHDVWLRDATYQLVGGSALAAIGAAATIYGIVRLASGPREPPQALWIAPTRGGLVAGGRF